MESIDDEDISPNPDIAIEYQDKVVKEGGDTIFEEDFIEDVFVETIWNHKLTKVKNSF